MPLNGKVALVTGGAVRIGRAMAEALAAEGATVVIHYRSSGRAAMELAGELGGSGAPHTTIQADLSDTSQCEALIGRVLAGSGRLDILVNNAAVFESVPISSTSAGQLSEQFRVNLFAPFILTRDFGARVKTGRVVNLLDRRITSADTDSAAYTLAKKSLAELTRLAALEYAPGITVNGIAPGIVLPAVTGENLTGEMIAAVPIKRKIDPEEIAAALIFLLENSSLTGQVLFLDGGENLLS